MAFLFDLTKITLALKPTLCHPREWLYSSLCGLQISLVERPLYIALHSSACYQYIIYIQPSFECHDKKALDRRRCISTLTASPRSEKTSWNFWVITARITLGSHIIVFVKMWATRRTVAVIMYITYTMAAILVPNKTMGTNTPSRDSKPSARTPPWKRRSENRTNTEDPATKARNKKKGRNPVITKVLRNTEATGCLWIICLNFRTLHIASLFFMSLSWSIMAWRLGSSHGNRISLSIILSIYLWK